MCEPQDSNLTGSVSHYALDSGYHCFGFNLLVLSTTCELLQATDVVVKQRIGSGKGSQNHPSVL
jgi:hypothetical protein